MVTKGYDQEEGIDYEINVLVAKLDAIRMLLAYGYIKGLNFIKWILRVLS